MQPYEYRLGLYEKAMPNDLTWQQKFSAAKQAGFDFIEISIDETDEKLARLDMPAEQREELVRRMHSHGIFLETMCLSGHRRFPLGSEDPGVGRQSLEVMQKAVLLARDLGVRIIQIAGYDEYYNESNDTTRANFACNLAKSVAFAAQYGVMLAFETMETPFLNTVRKAVYWTNKLGSPYLMVYPDSGNITNAALAAGQDVLTDIETGRGWLAAVHLKETVPGKFREIPYGTGHVDFKAIIQRTYAMGVRRYTGEFWYAGQPDWQADLQKNHDFLRAQFV